MVEKIVKFLGKIFWVIFVILLIFWYFQNKNEFFPSQKIEEIPNPVNPFR